jgi:hypothetical protein
MWLTAGSRLKRIRERAELLRAARARFGSLVPRYRVPSEAEKGLVAQLEASDYNRDLRGWRRLEARVEMYTPPTAASTFLTYVHPDQTIAAVLFVLPSMRLAHVVCHLMSFTETTECRTLTLSLEDLAWGPCKQVLEVETNTPFERQLARHREHVANAGELRTITSTKDLISHWQRIHEHVLAWRNAQDPVELLSADARAVYPNEPKLARFVERLLSGTLPKARIVVREPGESG